MGSVIYSLLVLSSCILQNVGELGKRATSESSTESKGEIASLLPKLNNFTQHQKPLKSLHSKTPQSPPPQLPTPDTSSLQRNNPQRIAQRQTNSNIFIEEPDIFIIPGQVKKPREKTPDSPPLKKPPTPLPIDEPETVGIRAPPPIPPKTYAKLVFPGGKGGDSPSTAKGGSGGEKTLSSKPASKLPDQQVGVVVVVQTELKLLEPKLEAREPKQSNVEREKGVRFHPDTKCPALPPPLPARERGQSSSPTTTTSTQKKANTKDDIIKIARETKTPVTTASTAPVSMTTTADSSSKGGSLDEIVAIVDENGVLVGELVPSPVDKEPPPVSSQLHQHYQLQQSPTTSSCQIAQSESEC